MNERKPATMADVAREAGVALGTVSKVVNGLPVGDVYRQKVEQAIRKLDYQVNTSAKALKSSHTNTVALIVPNTIAPFFALLTHHVNLALDKQNYKMLLCFTEFEHDREQEYIQLVRQNRVDGIIALTYSPQLDIPEGLPFVTIDRYFSASVPCVASDNFGGGRLAAQKLAELGCRHVACLRSGSSLVNEPSKRKDGFVSGCLDLGLEFEMCNLSDNAPLSAFEVFLKRNLLETDYPLDGLFCGTDLMAYQTVKMVRSLGKRVPEDVQIIGFDGMRMFGEKDYICSTIVQPVAEMAETAVKMVLSPDFRGLPQLICLPVRYQPGGTTREPVEETV